MKKQLAILAMAASLFAAPRASLAAAEYTLSLNLPIAPVHTRWTGAVKVYFDELQKRSGGRIAIEPYFAESLSKMSECADSVRNGLADVTETALTTAPGAFPFFSRFADLSDVTRSIDAPVAILKELGKEFPEIYNECKGLKILAIHALPVGMVPCTKEPIRSLDDFKGKKIGAITPATAEKLKALGATPVMMPLADMYISLQQGLLDGAVVDFQMLVSRRFGDMLKYMVPLTMSGCYFGMFMNEDVFNALPEDLQKIIDDMSANYTNGMFEAFWEKDQYETAAKWMKDMGGTIIMLSDADYAKARELTLPLNDSILKIMSENGIPADKLAKRFYELSEKYYSPWKTSRLAKEAGIK